jgi:hypothetical protein
MIDKEQHKVLLQIIVACSRSRHLLKLKTRLQIRDFGTEIMRVVAFIIIINRTDHNNHHHDNYLHQRLLNYLFLWYGRPRFICYCSSRSAALKLVTSGCTQTLSQNPEMCDMGTNARLLSIRI